MNEEIPRSKAPRLEVPSTTSKARPSSPASTLRAVEASSPASKLRAKASDDMDVDSANTGVSKPAAGQSSSSSQQPATADVAADAEAVAAAKAARSSATLDAAAAKGEATEREAENTGVAKDLELADAIAAAEKNAADEVDEIDHPLCQSDSGCDSDHMPKAKGMIRVRDRGRNNWQYKHKNQTVKCALCSHKHPLYEYRCSKCDYINESNPWTETAEKFSKHVDFIQSRLAPLGAQMS